MTQLHSLNLSWFSGREIKEVSLKYCDSLLIPKTKRTRDGRPETQRLFNDNGSVGKFIEQRRISSDLFGSVVNLSSEHFDVL